MMISAGDLRHQVTIQQRATTQDALGGPSTTWTTLCTTRAQISPLNGRELLAAQAVQSEVSHNVVMRYRPGITAAMRLIYAGRIFNIHAVIDDNEAHRQLSLTCSEGVNDG